MTGATRRGKLQVMRRPRLFSPRAMLVILAAAVLGALAACESGDAHLTGPRGGTALSRFVVIGSDLSMGVESGGVIATRYRQFRKQRPVWCREQKLEEHELQFNDYTFLIWRWLDAND